MSIRLGDLLVRAHVITPEQLAQAVSEQGRRSGKLGENLVELGFVTEDVLVRALAKLTGLPVADLAVSADVTALAKVPRDVAEEFVLVPLSLSEDGQTLTVVMADPTQPGLVEYLRSVSSCAIAAQFARPTLIRDAIARWYGTRSEPEGASVSAPDAETVSHPLEPSPSHAAETAPFAPLAPLHAADPSHPPLEQNPPPATLTSTRSGRMALVAIAVLALLLAVSLYRTHLLETRLDLSSKTIEAHLKTIALQTQQVDALDKLADRVDQFNQEFASSMGRLSIDDLEVGMNRMQKTDLSAKAKRALEDLDKNAAELKSITSQLHEFQQFLGSPIVVKRGDTHAELALDYLTGTAGLSDAQAQEVLKQTALSWELEPGNQVFNLYHDGILLSTVTQGSAARSPLEAQWSQRRALQTKAQGLEQKLHDCEAGAAKAPAPGQ